MEPALVLPAMVAHYEHWHHLVAPSLSFYGGTEADQMIIIQSGGTISILKKLLKRPDVYFKFFRHFPGRMRSLEFRHVYRTITSVISMRLRAPKIHNPFNRFAPDINKHIFYISRLERLNKFSKTISNTNQEIL